jgi:hypothetical protein
MNVSIVTIKIGRAIEWLSRLASRELARIRAFREVSVTSASNDKEGSKLTSAAGLGTLF